MIIEVKSMSFKTHSSLKVENDRISIETSTYKRTL